MEKLELKLKNMEYFVMRLQGPTTEKKLELLAAIGEMKKKVQFIKEGKEVKNVDENTESDNQDSNNTANDTGRVEEYAEKRELKKK